MQLLLRAGLAATVALGCSSEPAERLAPVKEKRYADCPLVPAPLPSYEFEVAGMKVKVDRGDAYVFGAGRWELVDHLYDPDYFEKNYVVEDCQIYRKDPETGARFGVRRSLSEDFARALDVRDLVGPDRGWTGFTLLSPAAPSIEAYVDLRACILKGTCDFLDNRLDLDADTARSGSSLRARAVPPTPEIVTSKASLESDILHFVRGDDVWFSGYFYVAEGKPLTLMDLESTWLKEAPGPRLMLGPDGALRVELKWTDKPTYVQAVGEELLFPLGQWVYVKVHYVLSESEDGTIELWQDGSQLLSVKGRTLPLPDTILNSLEIGISANNNAEDAVVYVDDIWIGTTPEP